MKQQSVYLIYDKECPVCDNYCSMINIKQSIGELILVDAREESDWLEQTTLKGLDIDQGMVLIIKDTYYYGSDAINALALISSENGIFNQFNYWCFKSKTISAVLYPLFRSFRNLLLKVLGKTKIDNLSNYKPNTRF